MAKYYLCDMHTADIADARIVDVVSTSSASQEFRVDGLSPIRVPDGVEIADPTDLTDLLDQKRAGLHALYPGFSSIVWDDLLDSSEVVPVGSSNTGYTALGSRGTIGGSVQSVVVDLSPAVLAQCVLVYERYSWKYVYATNGRFERHYVEDPGPAPVSLSANGGSSSTEYNLDSGSIITFDPLAQGSLLRILFPVPALSPSRVVPQLGYWAILY